LVDKWWFWLALAATAAFLIFVAFFMKRRNVLGKTIKSGDGQAGMRNPILPK
jgi:putative exporter of polyketide antibiotics